MTVPPPRKSRRWPWVILGTGLVVGGVVVYSPALFGGLLLQRYGQQAGLSGGHITGTLWSPKISGAALKLPGITASAGEVGVTATALDPRSKTAHIQVSVRGADVALQLGKLVGQQKGDGVKGQNGWKLVIDAIDVQDSRLKVDGQGVNVPNISARIDRGPDGQVLLHGHTTDGPLSAQLALGHTATGATYTLDIDADARVARHYWKGVQSGRIKGRYVFGDGPIQGDLRIINATLQVPEAKMVTVTGVAGRVLHRGDDLTLKLAGRGWDGPVTAQGGVDLKAKHWTVTANATPTLGGLARALKTSGEGNLKLRVTAGGWSTIRVKGYVQGAGKLAGVAFRDGNVEYSYLSHEGQHTGQTNEMAFSAKTSIAGQQQLAGHWAFGRAGQATWKGDLAGKALNLQAGINAHNAVALTGQALGGPLKAQFEMKGQQLEAVLHPDFGAARGQVALSGTPENLNVVISQAQAGPLALSGKAHYSKAGLSAELLTQPQGSESSVQGRLNLLLDSKMQGSWQAQQLGLAGAVLSGAGQLNLPRGDLSGNLKATLPGLAQPLSGPLSLNYMQRRGTFVATSAGTQTVQRLSWQGDAVRVQANGLPLTGGLKVSGDMRVTQKLQAFGQLSASGNGYHLSAEATGDTVSLLGHTSTQPRLTISAQSQLRAPYRTAARLLGTDISGVISVQNGVRFSLTTRGKQAQGVLNGQQLDATGQVDLLALRPLLPAGLQDLSGTLQLNLAGLGGSAQVEAQAAGARVSGVLRRLPALGPGRSGQAAWGRVVADLRANVPAGAQPAQAALSGQVYPTVQAAGTVQYLGQTLRASLAGPYDGLHTQLSGRTGELSFGGVTLPAQAVALSGTLTPALNVAGRWGKLNVAYNGITGLARLSGSQALSAFGKTAQVQGAASWGAGFKGEANLQGRLQDYALNVRGPWSRLNVLLNGPEGLRGAGTASLPAGKYSVDVNGPLTIPGQGQLLIDGTVQGTGAHPTGNILMTDQHGGRATLSLNGIENLSLQAHGLTLAGQRLEGQVQAHSGLLSGQIQAGPLKLVAKAGRVRASGSFGGHQVVATGQLTLPSTINNLDLRVTGPYLSAVAQGHQNDLHGTLTLKPQVFGPAQAQLMVPAQSFALSGSLTGARVRVGGLSWQGGQWGGVLGLRYALKAAGQPALPGQLQVLGQQHVLSVIPHGPLSGQLQVLPSLGGTLSAPLSPYLGLLPANLRGLVVPGQLVAQITQESAAVSLHQTTYMQRPLGLNALLNWKGGLSATATLTHGATHGAIGQNLSRVPLRYDQQGLHVQGATLNAQVLQPLVPGLAGNLKLNLEVPGMQWARANGQASVQLSMAGAGAALQTAQGAITLSQGQLAAQLSSTLAGQAVQVRGQLYPQANAVYSLRSLGQNLSSQRQTAQLSGHLSGDITQALNLTAAGTLQGQSINVRAVARQLNSRPSLQLSGTAAGVGLRVGLKRGAGPGLAGWALSGQAQATDLKKLAGTEGQVTAQLGGTLADVRLKARGQVAGISFTAPARYQTAQGQLRLDGATAHLPQGQVRASGTVFPKLGLVARASLTDALPGQYTAQISGPLTQPLLKVQGRLKADGSAVSGQVQLLGQGKVRLNVAAMGGQVHATLSQAASGGQWSGQVSGQYAGQQFQVGGGLYPQTSAAWSVTSLSGAAASRVALSGQVRGALAQTLRLSAAGQVAGHTLSLAGTTQRIATAAGQASLTGTVDNSAQLDLRVSHSAAAAAQGLAQWLPSGTVKVADLSQLTRTPGATEGGVAGQVTVTVGGTLQRLSLLAGGTVAGIPLSAPLTYAGGKLSASRAIATLPQGQVTASGTVYPALALKAQAHLTQALPGDYAASISGSYSRPLVEATGTVNSAVQGLDIAGTTLQARLLGKDWRATLGGPKVSGQVRGQLGSGSSGSVPGGLQTASLTLNTSLKQAAAPGAAPTTVTIQGPLAWNTRTGWTGQVRVAGQIPGGPLDATVRGQGLLNVVGTLGKAEQQASFTAQLPAALPLKPAGTLSVTHLDAGAFWGRAGQLSASGTATLGGQSWNTVQATFAGQLDDAAAELTGRLQASYGAGHLKASFVGPRVNAQASLDAGRYDLSLSTEPLHLARLLPSKLDIDALTFSGRVQASGSTQHGPESIRLENMALRGEQAQAGPFGLFGSAEYQPATGQQVAGQQVGRGEILKADLHGTLRSGLLSAQGELTGGLSSPGLNVQLKQIPTDFPGAAGFGKGTLDAQLHLGGPLRNPYLSGQLNTVTDKLVAALTLSGTGNAPRAHARLQLRPGAGQPSGLLYADLRDLNLSQQTVWARVYGTVQQGQNRAQVQLAGVWPQLGGQVQASVAGLSSAGQPQTVTLKGDGQGGYALSAGELGSGTLALTRTTGWIPKLGGQLRLSPLKAVQGGTGFAEVAATVGGSLSQPTVSGTLTTRDATLAGVSLQDATGTLSASLQGFSAAVLQAGRTVATLSGRDISLTGLGLSAAGSQLTLTGQGNLGGATGLTVPDLTVAAAGNVQGNLKASYAHQALSLEGKVSTQGLNTLLNLKASTLTGWKGTAQVSGGPSGMLTQAAQLQVKGPLAHPLVTGSAGLLGAGAKVVANRYGVQVRLVDGPATGETPRTTASGAIELRPDAAGQWVWSGATSLSRPDLSLSVTPAGPLADPQLVLAVRRGQWQASGTASKARADLVVSDGLKDGTLTWDGQQATTNLPGLNLARLGIDGLTGLLSASGTASTTSRNGQVAFAVTGLSSPRELPLVGIRPAGEVRGKLTLNAGKPTVQATASLNTGTLNLSATQSTVTVKTPATATAAPTSTQKTIWTGALAGKLKKDAGTLDINAYADATGLHGGAKLSQFVLNAAGRAVELGGSATLSGQTFSASLQTPSGSGLVTAEGGLADAVPALQNVLALSPTGEGYSAHALLNDINLENLQLAPNLGGQVSGEANFSDGGGTFLLKSAGLKLGPKTLPGRLEGTLVGGNWRLRGALGEGMAESDFTAGLNSAGEVYGSADLRALPLAAMIGAVSTTLPGEGVVTGIARFRFPLADPLAGTATVVAERIRVSAVSTLPGTERNSTKVGSTEVGSTAVSPTRSAPPATGPTAAGAAPVVEPPVAITETLMGSGSLDFANHELRNINVQLSGAGTWDVQGQYTHQNVNVSAKFTDTTFTPVLRLIPGLADAQPALKGTLVLSAAGTYDRPRALLRAQNLTGSVAGLSVQVPEFAGELPDSGALSAGGHILTGGTVGSDGRVDIQGQLTQGKLSGTQLKFSGLLAPQALGALPNTTATLSQGPTTANAEGAWLLDAQSTTTNPATGPGTLTLSGVISPHWNLKLAARNYNLPLSAIYAKESALTGDIQAVDNGQLIQVSGAADFARLTLGRVNAPKTIDAPTSATATDKTSASSSFVSPLPEKYTTFARPQQAQTTTAEAARPQATLPLLQRLTFDDLQIQASGGIRVDENLAHAEFGTSGLTVSGTAAKPRIKGEIKSERGSIFLRENEFVITDGKISFAGESLYPTFNITAQGSVPWSYAAVAGQNSTQHVPITLNVSGDFRTVNGQPNVLHLDTQLSCTVNTNNACTNPQTGNTFSEPELYALIATGVPDLSSLSGNLGALGSSAVQTALNVFVLGEINRTIAKALGVDTFSITPTVDTDGTVGATLTVGTYVARNLFLQYQTDLSGNGLIGAKYTTPDSKFTFEVSTPLVGLNLQSVRPSFSTAYNVNQRTSLSLGVENSSTSTKFKFGVTYRLGMH